MNRSLSLLRLVAPVLLIGLVHLWVISMAGCVAVEGKRERRQLASQPKDLQPVIVEAYPSVPIDSDRNGYVDTFDVTAYLFPDPIRHPAPLWIEGRFLFRMTGPDDVLLAEWELSEQETASARRVFTVGRGHWFRLNMLDVATDRIETKSAQISCTFMATNGLVLKMGRPTSIRLGSG